MLNATAITACAATIHAGTLSDVDALLAIECAAFASDRIGRAEFEDLTQSAKAAVLIARYGIAEAGALVLKQVGAGVETEAYLYSLGVVPEFRRLGVGDALLDEAVAIASRWQAWRIVLEVRPDNLAAIAFYAGAGFVTIGRRSRWYEDGSPALRMAWLLPWKPSSNQCANEAQA